MGTLDRFEGSYGAAYDAVLQRPGVRRALFRAVGSAQPIVELEAAVEALVKHAPAGALLDVPCGGGTLLPMLHRAGFHGELVAIDLAAAMIRRMRRAAGEHPGAFNVQVLHADATKLPLEAGSFDLLASINGLHVLPEPERALSEFARVLRPGGMALVVTITASGELRNRVLRRVARVGSVLPRDVASRAGHVEMFERAGLAVERDLGGTTFAGWLLRRADPR